ncbi:MAG: cytochrome c [Acidobacteriota bacterium]|nr:cytochrome c [Acidobacteriota bacterium]
MFAIRDFGAPRKGRRRLFLRAVVGAVAFGALLLVLGFQFSGRKAHADARSAIQARGEYLVMVAGCNDCHTPWKLGPHGPEPDMRRMLSGHPEGMEVPEAPVTATGPWTWAGTDTNTAFAGPWGVSYAPNLTPDENTGIGIWTEDIFVNTLRSGRHWGVARPILPPMPWQNFARMTDEDLTAIFAYLRFIPPVTNRVPESQPAAVQQAATGTQ